MGEEKKNAWHHVRGISSEEMRRAVEDAERLYGDILDRARPISEKHPELSMEQKAAQFSPFAALSGYDDAIEETGRVTFERRELDEEKKAELDGTLQLLSERGLAKSEVEVTYFVPDVRKDGGEYRTVQGYIRRIDREAGRLVLRDGTRILLSEIQELRF